ncbi:MAG: WYL domain-containing protein [Clostridiales bacterium]|nr:WYL domain-containing protein [Clostridiales bacterium]
MSKANNQKIKLLLLYDMLKQETDEQHPLTTRALCAKLGELGITCDRRTLSNDIKLLNEYNYEVMSVMIGHEKAYYIEDRSFSVPELKILIDAVQAATFITEKKTNELIDKLASLSSNKRAEVLKGNMVCFNTIKHSNEFIFYNVGFLNEAIQQNKKASFYYFYLDENGQKQYRKNKERYIVDPVALIYNDDKYYLMCYSTKYDGITNYRIDRMEQVAVEEEEVSTKAIINTEKVSNYTEQVFKMYGGDLKDVVLQFDKKLIGVVYDKFGENTKMMVHNEETCITTVKIQVSPTFFGWLFQFGDRMKILSPESLIREYKSRAREICEYNDMEL